MPSQRGQSQVVGVGVVGNRIFPRALRRIAVVPHRHHVELADGARGQQFLRLVVNDGTHALAADLHNPARLAPGVNDLGPIGVDVDHGLFAVNVFARVHGIHRRLHVPVVRSADNDRVDVLARQDFVVVARGLDIVAPQFLGMLQAAVVTVRRRHHLDARHHRRQLGVPLALPARSNQVRFECDRSRQWAWPAPAPAPPSSASSSIRQNTFPPWQCFRS